MPKHKHVSDGQAFAAVTSGGRVIEKTRCLYCPITVTRPVKKTEVNKRQDKTKAARAVENAAG